MITPPMIWLLSCGCLGPVAAVPRLFLCAGSGSHAVRFPLAGFLFTFPLLAFDGCLHSRTIGLAASL